MCMYELMELAKSVLSERDDLPFSVYTSHKEQNIVNVPIMKPLLIFVLSGEKQLGKNAEIVCKRGNFVFLSNSPTIDMRNIPRAGEYYAILIDYDYEDFDPFRNQHQRYKPYCLGEIEPVLDKSLCQFIEWSLFAPKAIWKTRKQELLFLLSHLGYDIASLAVAPTISDQIHRMLSNNLMDDLSIELFCSQLAMSESTMRRRLKAEGTSLQAIKDQARLGHGLHLIQTSDAPIGLIAEQCGYLSQSRFTDRFKQRFGLTPSALRKTRMTD